MHRKTISTGSGKDVQNSPGNNNNNVKVHRKNLSNHPLSVQEETDDLVFSRDAQELLRKSSFSETLGEIKHTHRGWLKKLASNGRRWNRRYFVIHGHYLSYFKSDNTSDTKNLMGALNLWRVESVTLDQNIIVITLAPEVSVNTNSLINRALMKKTMANRILLEAKDSAEASHWITTMKVTPFEEPSPKGGARDMSIDELNADEFDDARSHISTQTQSEDSMKLKNIRVVISPEKSYDFQEVSELLSTTRLRIGELTKNEAEVTVEVANSEGKTIKANNRFIPHDSMNGVLRIPFPDGSEAQIGWERDTEATIDELIQMAMAEDSPSPLLVPLAAGMFVVTLFIVYIVLEFRFLLSTTVAAISSGSAAAMLSTSSGPKLSGSSTSRRFVFTSVSLVSNKRINENALHGTTKLTDAAAIKKGEKGEDVSILSEERVKLAELRKRLADIRTPSFIEKEVREGKFDRLLAEWNVTTASETLAAVQTAVCEKYLDCEFRLVRFLRARGMNVDKAEKMARQSLLWRMGLRPDFFVSNYNPPSWIVEYGGAPLYVQSLKMPGFGIEDRLQNWWLRDKQNALSMFFRAGVFDWRKVNRKMGDATALVKVGLWALEMGRRDLDIVHERSNGAIPSYFVAIIDMESFSLTQQIPLTELIPLARKFFSLLAISYPELLKRVIVVNTPFLFNGLWQALKPFIPEEVQDKIQIHGRCDIEKHLRPYFNDDQIPAYLGGKLVGDGSDKYCFNRLPPCGPFLPDAGAELLKLPK